MASSTRVAALRLLRASYTPLYRVAAAPLRPRAAPTSTLLRAPQFAQPVRLLSTESGNKIYSFDDVKKLVEEKKEGVVLIDTREPGELADTGRIPGAINIPVSSQPDAWFISEDEFEDRFGFDRPSQDVEIVMYCKAGVRSRAAAGLARQGGWENVGEYQGSWLDWAGSGGKIDRSQGTYNG